MSKEKKPVDEPTAITGSASIVDMPALRLAQANSDEIEKRAASYTASPVARVEQPKPKPSTEK